MPSRGRGTWQAAMVIGRSRVGIALQVRSVSRRSGDPIGAITPESDQRSMMSEVAAL